MNQLEELRKARRTRKNIWYIYLDWILDELVQCHTDRERMELIYRTLDKYSGFKYARVAYSAARSLEQLLKDRGIE